MDTKAWYLSKTIWGGILTAVFMLLAVLGRSVSAEDQSFLSGQAMQAVDAIGQLVGIGLTIYGRFKAKTTIGPSPVK
jgi:hypothetical protein